MLRAILFVSATGALASPALAHHSRAAYDLTKEVTLEGTVVELAWTNPHIYVTVETLGEDGKPDRVDVEVTSVSEAAALGLPRDAIAPGARVTVRAHPGRGAGASAAARAVGLGVTSAHGAVYPRNTDARVAIRHAAVPASGIAGRWSPTLESFNGIMAAVRSAPTTEAARAEVARRFQTENVGLGICEPFPPPILSIFPDLRTIEVNDTTVAMRFEGAVGLNMDRVVYLNQQHPADVAPSLMGHSIGRFEGETLVIDTVAFTPHHVGVLFLPSGPSKHLVERLTLSSDRLRLEYSFTVEDADILTAPLSYTATWDHRPDLMPSGVACDPEVARRALR
jgi:hypothetical protein